MSREELREKNLYYTIIGGTFRTQVDKDDPTAVRRDWVSADGSKSGTKYERIVKALYGYIEDIQFRDSEYGLQCYVMLDTNADGFKPVITLSTASRETEDFLRKLPNINLLEEVQLRPFDFEGDSGEVRGISVMQADATNGEFNIKITNYFRDQEKKENINGFPTPEGDIDGYTKDDWKLYFLQARKFLVNYTKEVIQAKVAQALIDRGTAVPKSLEQEQRLNREEVINATEDDDWGDFAPDVTTVQATTATPAVPKKPKVLGGK
jgi:hypothetical protein